MKTEIASVYSDNDPDSSRRYIEWTRYTLYSDGSVILESGTEDSDLWGISETASEANPTKTLNWSDLSSDIQDVLKQNAKGVTPEELEKQWSEQKEDE